MKKYAKRGYEVEDLPAPGGYKDYNEWLVATKLVRNDDVYIKSHIKKC